MERLESADLIGLVPGGGIEPPTQGFSGLAHVVSAGRFWYVGSLDLAGEAVPVLEGVHTHGNFQGSQFAISRAGALAYSGVATGNQFPGPRLSRLVSVDRAGRSTELPHAPDNYRSFGLSPDGQKLAVSARSTQVL